MKSLIQFFEESVEKYNSNVYLWEKPNDKYEGTTYGETKKQVYEFAAGLIKLGIKKVTDYLLFPREETTGL